MEPAGPPSAVPREPLPEIDWLKGFAIVCVVLIHAKLFEPSLLHTYVVNRAVPIFLVLLGVNSEFFFGARQSSGTGDRLGAWLESRVSRLLPPLWAMGLAWLAAVFYFDRARDLDVGPREALLTLLGWAPWMGTAWFITLVLQLVVLFPAIRWACLKLGPLVVLPVSAFLCGYCIWRTWDIVALGTRLLGPVPPPGWFYLWIFVPRVLLHVAAGVYVARYTGARPGARLWLGCAALWAASVVLLEVLPPDPAEAFTGPMRQVITENLLDLPLTVALLGAFGRLTRFRGALPLRFLARCGRASWGIYLGHLLVYEVLHLRFVAPETGPASVRAVFAASLLALGLALALSGDRLRRAARPRALV